LEIRSRRRCEELCLGGRFPGRPKIDRLCLLLFDGFQVDMHLQGPNDNSTRHTDTPSHSYFYIMSVVLIDDCLDIRQTTRSHFPFPSPARPKRFKSQGGLTVHSVPDESHTPASNPAAPILVEAPSQRNCLRCPWRNNVGTLIEASG
jgi:hypothetical protein